MYSNILVAVDLTHGEIGGRLLELARLLGGGKASITLFSVVQPLPSYIGMQATENAVETHRKEVEQRLSELAAGAGGSVETRTGLGSPAGEILAEAKRMGADAILVGSHQPGISDYLIGSTAARVVRHAPCTVVVDRSGIT